MSSSEYVPSSVASNASFGSAHSYELRGRNVPTTTTAHTPEGRHYEVVSSTSQGTTGEIGGSDSSPASPSDGSFSLLSDNDNTHREAILLRAIIPDIKQAVLEANAQGNTITPQQLEELISSTQTQSIIANAVARGLGAAASSAIVNAIFSSLKAPFQTASSVASTINEGASALNNATEAVHNVAQAVQDVQTQVKGASSTLESLMQDNNAVSASIKSALRKPITTAVLSDVSAPPQHTETAASKLRAKRLHQVVFGDNSVTMINVAEKQALLDSSRDLKSSPTLWQDVVKRHHQLIDLFTINAQGQWLLSSNNAWYDGAGEQVVANQFDYHVMHSHANHAPANNIQDPVVVAAPSVRVKQLAEMAIADYMTAGNINDRTVQNTLNGFLHPANIAVLRDVAFKLGEPVFFYDNTMMYAKLLHYALLRQIMAHTNVVPVANAWAPNVHFVNLDDQALAWGALATPIQRGDIVLIDGYDWTAADPEALQLVQLLSTNAHPLGLPADAVAPISRTTVWPQIEVSVLTHGAAPALPAAALIDASSVINFARKLAAARSEQDQLLRGLYCAVEMIGSRLMLFQPNPEQKRVLSPFFGLANYSLPRPRDFNFLARFLNLRPAAPPSTATTEIDAYATRSDHEVCMAIALYHAAIQAAATTYYAGANISLQLLISRATNANDQLDPNLRSILNMLDQPAALPSIATAESDAAGRVIIRNLAMKMFGLNIYSSLWWNTVMLFQPNSLTPAQAAVTFHALDLARPPRYSTLYGLTTYVTEYPYEWGCSERGAHFDITKEVVRTGPAAARGWRSVLGDHKYDQSLTQNSPFLLQMYGWQVLQCMCNRTLPAAQPPGITTMTNTWQQGVLPSQWTVVPAANQVLPVFNVDAHAFEPCSFMSYNWEDHIIYAPHLQLAMVWWQSLSRHDGARPTCGFDALDRDLGAQPAAQPDMMDLSFLMGMSLNAPPKQNALSGGEPQGDSDNNNLN